MNDANRPQYVKMKLIRIIRDSKTNTLSPIICKSSRTSGGKYSNQCCGLTNFRISSSLPIPRLRMIFHWYFSEPVLAATFDYENQNKKINRLINMFNQLVIHFDRFCFVFFLTFNWKIRWKTKIFDFTF